MNMVPADAGSCPTCGFNGSQQNPEICLSIGYRLNNRYVVGRQLDSDGDSVSYAGYDVQLSKKIEIREFLPINGCSRNKETGMLIPKVGAELHYKTSLMDFSDLFKNLNKLTYEDGIVKTLDFFEANQTAYGILEFFDAVTLREFLGLKSGIVSWEQCSVIMEPVFNALNSIHSVNLTHRGVSPETILISRSGEIKLSGFATTSVRTKGTDVASKLFPGYSAPEQYSTTMWQSTATDVYGLAATIYRCITGATPQDADQRRMYDNMMPPSELNSTIPASVSKSIMLALLVDQQTRTQTVLGFRQMLSGGEERIAGAVQITDEDEYDERDSYEDYDEPAEVSYSQPDKVEKLVKTVAIVSAAIFVLMLIIYLVMGLISKSISKPLADETTGREGETVSYKVTVPDYTGLMLSDIDGKLDILNFNYLVQSKYNASEPEGKIVSTDPAPNSTANYGDTIILYVNMTKVITMIDFEGLTMSNAKQELSVLEIPESNYEFVTEDTDKGLRNTIFKQSIEPGEEFNVNSDKLTLTIAIHPDGEKEEA